MMKGPEEERGILGVEGAREPIWGEGGVVSGSQGTNQEESSCWKDISVLLFLLMMVLVLVGGFEAELQVLLLVVQTES